MAESFASIKKAQEEDAELFISLFEPKDDDKMLGLFVPSEEYVRTIQALVSCSAVGGSLTAKQSSPPTPDKEKPDPNAAMEGEVGIHSLSSPVSCGDNHLSPPLETDMGPGIRNMGYSCFVTSILQCFTDTVPLVMALRTHNNSSPCERGSDGFCALVALRDHIQDSLTSSEDAIDPGNFLDKLSRISSSFQSYQQEDAHEFMHYLLGRLRRCCLHQNPAETSSSSEADNIVQQLSGGQLLGKLKCCSCGHVSVNYEPLIDLSLDIEMVDTLSAALESFTKVERVETEAYNSKDRAIREKQLMLDWSPPVAILHLKRFKSNEHSTEKIDKHVQFPLELDLTPYSNHGQDDHVDLRYQLYGVVVHDKHSLSSGHYLCYIRSSPGTWHEFNNQRVTKCEEDFVLSRAAYILMYARKGTAWSTSLMEVNQGLSNENSDAAEVVKCFSDDAADNEPRDGMFRFDDEELWPKLTHQATYGRKKWQR